MSYLKIPDNALKKTQFTEAQFVFALRQADTGVPGAEVCRKRGIRAATYYHWKKKYGGLGVPELRRLKQLEAESQQLKQLVADRRLAKQLLQEVLKKKVLKPVQRRHAAHPLLDAWHSCLRRACQGIGLQRSSWSDKAHGRDDTVRRHRLRELAQRRIRYGCRRLHTLLRRTTTNEYTACSAWKAGTYAANAHDVTGRRRTGRSA